MNTNTLLIVGVIAVVGYLIYKNQAAQTGVDTSSTTDTGSLDNIGQSLQRAGVNALGGLVNGLENKVGSLVNGISHPTEQSSGGSTGTSGGTSW